MRKLLLISLLTACSISISYADTASDYAKAQQFIASNNLSSKSSQSIESAPILKTIQPNTAAKQARLQNMESMQNNPDAMASAGSSNATSQMVTTDMLKQPEVNINPNSSIIKNAETVQDNAAGIAAGTYKDCGKQAFNKITYANKTCDRPRSFQFSCHKKVVPVFPNDPIIPTQHCEHLVYNSNGQAPANSRLFKEIRVSHWLWNNYTVYIYLVSGVDANGQCYLDGSYQQLTSNGNTSQPLTIPSRHTFALHNVYSSGWTNDDFTTQSHLIAKDGMHLSGLTNTGSSHNQMFVTKQQSMDPLKKDTDVSEQLSSTSNTGWWDYLTFSFLTFPKVEVPQPTFKIIDQCAASPVAHSSACSAQAIPTCIDNKARTYNGHTYNKCWDSQTTYQCGGTGTNTCSPLTAQGCDLLSSTCSQNVTGVCTHENATYRCPISSKQGDGLVCGNHIYCLDGKCQKIPTSENKSFGQAATQLSAVNSAASGVAKQNPDPSINQKNIRIFSGKQASCRDMALGVMNCCQDSGWAKGIITNCKDSEKELGEAKEKGGLVVYVGRYCSGSFLGICLKHKKGYCQFPSRMAADVQIGGRKQFNRNFGSADSPNCTGFSPQEIQKIDFSKIDFSNVIQQTENNTNLPNNAANQSAIAREIARKMHGGQR